MSILKISKLGNPVLRQQAKDVVHESLREPPPSSIQTLIDDMIDSMRHHGGVGIAAPQVGQSLAIVIAEYQANERYPDMQEIPLEVYINPKVKILSGDQEGFWESCLSLSDFRGWVVRPTNIAIEYLDRQGEARTLETGGFLARILQHEIDHLHGKVFLDRMDDLTKLSYQEEFETFWMEKTTDLPEI